MNNTCSKALPSLLPQKACVVKHILSLKLYPGVYSFTAADYMCRGYHPH